MNRKVWIIFSMVVIIGLVGLVLWKQENNNGESNNNTIDIAQFVDFDAKAITADNVPDSFTGDQSVVIDNYIGKIDSKVTVIEYADFQCPGCASLAPTMRAVNEKYRDRVVFVYRYFPLPYHNNGYASAVAAEAAARQGKFWEMHALLFDNKPSWENASIGNREDIFAGYAESVGADVDKWRDDYKNYRTNGIKTKIDFQQSLGKAEAANGQTIDGMIEITSTPAVLVNGQELESRTEDSITKAIDQALAE